LVAELFLLGQFRLRLSGASNIELPSHKDRALLAILALQPGIEAMRDSGAWSRKISDLGKLSVRKSAKLVI
jgi:DNA-binding SARP family transcriptional activator